MAKNKLTQLPSWFMKLSKEAQSRYVRKNPDGEIAKFINGIATVNTSKEPKITLSGKRSILKNSEYLKTSGSVLKKTASRQEYTSDEKFLNDTAKDGIKNWGVKLNTPFEEQALKQHSQFLLRTTPQTRGTGVSEIRERAYRGDVRGTEASLQTYFPIFRSYTEDVHTIVKKLKPIAGDLCRELREAMDIYSNLLHRDSQGL